jgi:hypothetical protein
MLLLLLLLAWPTRAADCVASAGTFSVGTADAAAAARRSWSGRRRIEK